jgi:hypothetical protein
MFLNYFFSLQILLSIIALSNQQNEFSIENILKHAKQGYVKSYLQLPDADIFINSDVNQQNPAKFYNATDNILSLFNNWDENEFVSNASITSLIFANMTESTFKNGIIESKTNVARFLQQKDEYSYETSIVYQMPLFIKLFFCFLFLNFFFDSLILNICLEK